MVASQGQAGESAWQVARAPSFTFWGPTESLPPTSIYPHTTPALSSASMPATALDRGPFVHCLPGGQGPPVLEERVKGIWC